MANEKKAAVPMHNDHPNTKEIIPLFESAVKDNDLQTVLAIVGIIPKDAVKVLREQFPKIDKSTLSKCARPDKYGCVLHPDGYTALGKMLNIVQTDDAEPTVTTEAAPRGRDSSGHRYKCRVAGRLPDEKFMTLQKYIRMEGYETTQDWVTAQVDAFIEKMEAKYGKNGTAGGGE